MKTTVDSKDLRPLNIIIAHFLPGIVSGAENSIADFIDQLTPRFHVTMLVPGEGNLASFFRGRGINVWTQRVETPRRMFPGLHQIQSWFLAKQLHRRKIDLVVCNTFPAASRIGTACRIADIPYAIYMRDYIADTPLHRQILRQANALFCISKDVQQAASAMVGEHKTRLTYNYINPDTILDRSENHIASGERILPFSPSNPVVGLIGRVTRYKQPDLFLRAVPLVVKEIPNARFVMVGSAQDHEKPYEKSLRELAMKLGINDVVAFMGHRKDAIEITSELSVSCLASSREPLGRVILEAQLIGIPVVVPDKGGPSEIVKGDETGLCFSSSAPDAEKQLATQIIRLLRDQELRDCLVKNAREQIYQTFANQKYVQVQEAYFSQVANQSH